MWRTEWSYGLTGGLMIGLAAVLLLVFIGRVMGASGLLGGLVDGSGRANWSERAAFVAALIGAPARGSARLDRRLTRLRSGAFAGRESFHNKTTCLRHTA